jgi:predicted protein tyrosine phosphatase
MMRTVLFVCGKARMRSPTAAEIAPGLLGVEADYAGLSNDADVPISAEQIEWAAVIAVMERVQLARLRRRFGPELRGKHLVCLDVPDRYTFLQAELITLLTTRFVRLAPKRDPAP